MSFFDTPGSTAKFETVGDTVTGVINSPITQRQMKKFGSDDLDFWPAKNGRPQEAKMEALINLTTDEGDVTLYIPKGHRKQKAIGKALREAGAAELEIGGELSLTYTGSEQGRGSFPAKLFSARYKAPAVAPATAAPVGAPAAAAAPASMAASVTIAEDPWA